MKIKFFVQSLAKLKILNFTFNDSICMENTIQLLFFFFIIKNEYNRACELEISLKEAVPK